MPASPPQLQDLQHMRLCYSRERYCGHPRQGGLLHFNGDEIAVLHHHAPSAYHESADVRHDFGGYHSRSVVLLQRSVDGGHTWPADQEVVVYDESAPIAARRDFLGQQGRPRARISLGSPDSAIFFGRTYAGPENESGRPAMVCFAIRSADRGRTWEQVPTVITPPAGRRYVHKDNHPLVVMPDGSVLGAMTIALPHAPDAPAAIALFGSDDDGLTWEYLAEIARDDTGAGRPTYAGLLLLPGGRLQCYMLNIGGARNALQMAHSDDGGYSWSQPRPIVAWGRSPWIGRRHPDAARAGVHYRSPWPLRLRDGRIVVLFGRRKPPFGIGVLISEDDGATWSPEAIVRDDGSGSDLSYPVATELDDGRIFTAYYFMNDDGNGFGGTRHIAGSTFRMG